MIDSLSPSNSQFLADLARIRQTQERTQRQISSGLRVTRPSDAPGDVRGILQAKAELDRVTQIHTNLTSVKSEVDMAEGVLENAEKILETVNQLGAQGATGTQTPETRGTIAAQVEGLQQQLVGIAGTSLAGRYLFSGDEDQVAPYTLDLSQPGTGVTSNIDWGVTQATRQIMHPGGSAFPISRTAQEIFDTRDANGDPAVDNVFAAVNSLRIALQSNPTVPRDDAQYQAQCDAQQAAINGSMASLQKAQDHLNTELIFYGNAQNQVGDAIDTASKAEVRDQAALSDLQDADLPTAILEMTQAQTHEQATLSARAQMPRTSLFDFLG